MIRITCGTCGTSKGYKTAADGALVLPASEEKRLVHRGVAAYVTRPVIGAGPANQPALDGSGASDAVQDSSDEKGPAEGAAGSEKADSAEIARLERMPKGDLEQMAQDMGVDISGAKNNRERAELLAAAMASEDDGIPPEMEDEDIVR